MTKQKAHSYWLTRTAYNGLCQQALTHKWIHPESTRAKGLSAYLNHIAENCLPSPPPPAPSWHWSDNRPLDLRQQDHDRSLVKPPFGPLPPDWGTYGESSPEFDTRQRYGLYLTEFALDYYDSISTAYLILPPNQMTLHACVGVVLEAMGLGYLTGPEHLSYLLTNPNPSKMYRHWYEREPAYELKGTLEH